MVTSNSWFLRPEWCGEEQQTHLRARGNALLFIVASVPTSHLGANEAPRLVLPTCMKDAPAMAR